MKFRLVIFSFVLMLTQIANAQITPMKGTDFWVAFMKCHSNYTGGIYLIQIIAPNACTATISNPSTSWSQTVTLAAGETNTITIPSSEAFSMGSCAIKNTGIHVEATDSVYVFSATQDAVYNSKGMDATSIFPKQSLQNEYIVLTYPVVNRSIDHEAEFSILAPEDRTVIDIDYTGPTPSGITAGSRETITLNRGQVYQVIGTPYNSDFSGTRVKARNRKPIAVFNGNSGAYVPASSGCSSDNIHNQAIPIHYWGQQFLLTACKWHNHDYVRITALYDSCEVRKDGVLITTLNALQTFETEITDAAYVETSQPAMVLQFIDSRMNCGAGCDWGDIAMVPVIPLPMMTKEALFSTFELSSRDYYTTKYYVNIIAPIGDTSLITFDGHPLTNFIPVSGNTNYAYCRKDIASGNHNIHTTGSGFAAYSYGLGENWESYSIALNMMVDPLVQLADTTRIFHDTIQQCNNSEILLHIDDLESSDIVLWDTPNFDTITSGSLTLQITTPGDYLVRAFVQSSLDPCSATDIHEFFISISEAPTIYDTVSICLPPYVWNGNTYLESGDYDIPYADTMGCFGIKWLHLSIIGIDTTFDTLTLCDDLYMWHDLSIETSGNYEYRFTGMDGCDDIEMLNLTLYPSYSFTLDTTILYGESYTWIDGNNYTESINTTYSLLSQFGCDSIYNLNLNFRMPESELWIPNVFTPDERTNKTFKINGIGIEKLEVVIYNRWGDFVYRWEGLDGYWDGTHNGNKCKSEAYVYKATYIDNKGTKQTKFGSVLLLR